MYTVLLVILVLFMIAVICYQYPIYSSKLKKHIAVLTIQKWRIIDFKMFVLKIVRVIISMK